MPGIGPMCFGGWLFLHLFVGNVSAVRQKSVKRMLAYSSVAHAGYIAIAIVSMSAASASAIFFYTFTYSISSISAFTILFIVSRHKGSEDISAFEGMEKQIRCFLSP